MPATAIDCVETEEFLEMRFYFNVRDELPIHDGLGREFDRVSDAVMHAKCLAADLRCLATDVRPHLSIQVFAEGSGQIHEEAVFA